MTLQPLEKDRVRIRNLLEKEIKTGFKLITDDFKGFDLKSFAEQIGTCISSVNTLSDELDAILSKMSLIVQGPDETIMYEKQMDSDFAVMELACDLNSTLGVMKRFLLSRVTRCKEPILSSNDFENICKAINRNGSLQLDEILTSHQNTENDYQIKRRGHVIGKNTKQKPSIDKASDTLHESSQNTCVVFDTLESTQDIQAKSLINTTDLKQNTNQLGNKQKSRRRKKKKRVVAVLESLSTGNNRSKCGKRRIVQPRQGNKVKTKKRRPSMMHHAKLSKVKMPQHWRHDWLASQNEQYQTRGDKMEAQGKFDGWSQLHVVKTGTWLYKGKAKKWKNKPKKRHKKIRKKYNYTALPKQMTTLH